MKKKIIINDTDASFKILFSQNPQPMWIVDIETLKFLAVNDACIKQYGYTRKEFLSGSLTQIRPLAEHESMKELIRTITNNQTVRKDLTHLKKDGTAMNVHITSFTVDYHARKCRMVIIHDDSFQQMRESKLREAWRRVRQTLESITDGFFTLDRKLKITYLNKEAERIMGVKRCEVLNKKIIHAVPQVRHTHFYTALNKALKEKTTEKFEQYIPEIDKWICPVIYPNKTGMSVYVTDITREKKAQEIINDFSHRFEELAYVNSHQIRKEVANILGILNLAENELHEPCQLKDLLTMMNKSAGNLDQTIKIINSRIEG